MGAIICPTRPLVNCRQSTARLQESPRERYRSGDTAARSGALDGLRILEVAGLFGAYCGKLFAELGADVILVEPPGGAPQRRTGPFLDEAPGPDGSLTFAYLHSSKRGVTLDLDTADGQVLFR